MRSLTESVSTNSSSYTVLIVESLAADQELYRRYLLADLSCRYILLEADSANTAALMCQKIQIDGILVDGALHTIPGWELFQELQTRLDGTHPPMVVVANENDPAIVVRVIKSGAEDYLIKQTLTPEQLQLAMRSAIENAKLRMQLQQSNDRFRASLETMLDCFGIFSAIRNEFGKIIDFRFDYLNAAALKNNAMTPDDMSKTLCEVLPAHRDTELFEDYCRVVETGEPLVKENLIYSDIYGKQYLTRAFDIRASKLGDGFVASWRDVTDHKQAEAALRESEQRFRAIFNTMFQFIGLLTPDGILIEANQTALDFGGLTHEEVLGRPFWEVRWWSISPQTQQQLKDAIAEARQGKFVRYEVEVLGAGDTTTIVDFSLKPVRDETGQVVLLIPEGRDISDRVHSEGHRKRDEQRLRESEERLQLGVKVAGVALARFDYASNTVTLSPEAAALYGIPLDELTVTRDRVHATFHPDERSELAQIIKEVIDPAGSGWFAREHRLVWQNGEVRWLNVRKQVFFDRSGKSPRPDYAILAAIDITDRKRAEAALRQSEERYRSLAGLIPQLVWIAEPAGMMVDLNERWLTYTGLTLEQAQIQGWEAVIHPEDVSTLASLWRSAQIEGTVYQAEGRMRRADGVYRWHLHQAMPLKDEQGQIVKWFGTATDIHEIKLIEADRVRLLAEAEAANRSKDDFVSLLAHELRSPLQAIMGWAKLLQTRRFDEITANKALETIIRNAQSQVRLVEDLLDVSRMVRSTLQLDFASVNLVEVVEMAVETVRPTAEAKRLQLETQLDPTVPIRGDSTRLQQVVLNLLTNAIKFTPEGRRVQVILTQHDSSVKIQVRDTGKGITPEFLPYIFARFSQDENNTTAKQGLGLGLAIVKYIVELHRGTVTAESAGERQGSTFTIMLPLLQDDEVEAEPFTSLSSNDSSQSLSGVRVLVVDDDLDMLNLTAFMLEQSDATVQIATDAATALEQVSQFQPDILISDIAMPENNGYELLQQVRLIQPEGQIPAIALSAYAGKTHRENSMRAGFAYHVAKPVEPEELVKVVLSLIQRRAV